MTVSSGLNVELQWASSRSVVRVLVEDLMRCWARFRCMLVIVRLLRLGLVRQSTLWLSVVLGTDGLRGPQETVTSHCLGQV
jgi:hypothetical protein